MKGFLALIFILLLCLIFFRCSFKRGDDFKQETGSAYDYTNPKAAKEISSKEISFFSYSFVCDALNQYYGRNIPYRRCSFTIERGEDGALCTGSAYGDFDLSFSFNFTAAFPALDELQVLVDKHEIVKVNGIDKGIYGIAEEFFATRLEIGYLSGEKVFASDNSGPLLGSQADLDIYDFFIRLADNLDENFSYKEEFLEDQP